MTKPKPKEKPQGVETEPDAWDRFRETVSKVVPAKRPKPKKEGER